jgi:hypothetical protein
VRWRPARNAPLPSADDLRASVASAERQLRALEVERTEIVEALPALATDPQRTGQAEARMAELDALIPIKRRTLENIAKAIPAAENRSMLDRIRAERTALETRTAKLKRGLPERYNRAAEAFAQVLREMADNTEEWRRVNLSAGALGEGNGEGAELSLRREIGLRPSAGGMPGGWASLCDDIEVRDWNGRLIFGGPAGSY